MLPPTGGGDGYGRREAAVAVAVAPPPPPAEVAHPPVGPLRRELERRRRLPLGAEGDFLRLERRRRAQGLGRAFRQQLAQSWEMEWGTIQRPLEVALDRIQREQMLVSYLHCETDCHHLHLWPTAQHFYQVWSLWDVSQRQDPIQIRLRALAAKNLGLYKNVWADRSTYIALWDYQVILCQGRLPKPLPPFAEKRLREAETLARGEEVVEEVAVVVPRRGQKLEGTKKARRKARRLAELERINIHHHIGNLERRTLWHTPMILPRYADETAECRGRPHRQRTGPGGRGRRAWARLYRTHYLTNLLAAVVDHTTKLWKQLVPYAFNSPYSYRWRRLNRRGYLWIRFVHRWLRWGPNFGKRVLARLRTQRRTTPDDALRLARRPQDFEADEEFRLAFQTLPGAEWRLRLRQLEERTARRRRITRALTWLNRQMTKVYQDARINMRTGEIRHTLRTKKFVLRKRKVRSFRRKRRRGRKLRRRLLRWCGQRPCPSHLFLSPPH